MPVYTYRREDGTTFDVRQKFADAPLTTDPATGQPVFRVVHAAGIIFKGSGFYVNDSKGAAKSTAVPAKSGGDDAKPAAAAKSSEAAPSTPAAAASTPAAD